MKRAVILLLSAASLAQAIVVCFFWARGLYAVDEATLRYDRYLANGRCASDAVYLTSEKRLWLTFNRGSVDTSNVNVVWGYQVNANASGGKPKFQYGSSPYASHPFASEGRQATDDRSMPGWGPIRWQDFRRSKNGEQFRSIKVGVSHWLIVMCLLALTGCGFYCLRHSKAWCNREVKTTEEGNRNELVKLGGHQQLDQMRG